jgi:hypothetical protein
MVAGAAFIAVGRACRIPFLLLRLIPGGIEQGLVSDFRFSSSNLLPGLRLGDI